jgi:uncharacterized protein
LEPRPSVLEAVAALLLVAGAPSGAIAAPAILPPKPTRYATDQTGVIPPPRLAVLNEKLATFERETSNQVLVYVDRRVPEGTTLEEMAAQAVRSWGVGQKDRSNGAVLFVFVDQRAMRLEVGYGLEGAIPDARAKQITSDVMKPFFKKGDYAGGVEAGVDAVLRAARGEGYAGRGRTVAEGGGPSRSSTGLLPGWTGPFFPAFTALLVLVRRLRRWRHLSAGKVLSTIGMILLGVGVGAILAAILCAQPLWMILAFPTGLAGVVLTIVGAAMGRAGLPGPRGSRVTTRSSESSWASSSDWSSSSSDSSSSSSGSSSSSDFSGGGGDSGGGGSSDSW